MLDKKKADKANEEAQRQAKNDGDRNKILENISGDLSKSLAPVLQDLAKNSKLSTDDIRQALAEAIQINLPEIKMPDIPAPVVNVPAPIVHVPAPTIPAPKVTVQPTPVTFPTSMRLTPNDKPFPVRMVDINGKDVQFPVLSGGSGTNFPREVLDNTGTNPALRITGNLSVSTGNNSTQAIDSSGNPYSQANPLPVVFGSSGTTGTNIVDSSGVAYSGSNPVPVVFGASATQAVNMVDSSGVAYSGTNPVPVTIPTPIAQGDAASALRVVLAGNADASVVVNSGTITTVTTLTGITNSVAVMEIDSGGVAYSGSNPFPMNNTQWGGVATPTGLNETNGGVVRTVQMTDSVSSVVVNSGTITTVTTLTGVTNTVNVRLDTPDGIVTTANPFPVAMVSGGIDSTTVTVAHTALPAAKSDGADVRPMADKYGRNVARTIQVRDLVATAFVQLTTGTEATLLAASAGKQYDLIWILLSNESTAAVQVDLRAVTAGNKIMSFQVPANGTVGIAPPVPLNATSDTGNNWTVDMPDITGTTVDITALFTQEI